MIDEKQLSQIAKHCRDPHIWVKPLNDTFQRFGFETPHQIALLMSQIVVESDHLNRTDENLNYSPGRICEVWPTRFKDLKAAQPYARNPEKLANCVYAKRNGNGTEQSRDGFRFRGRGLLQITGRDNYGVVRDALDLPGLLNYPDQLSSPKLAALSAGAWWKAKGLLREALSVSDVTKVVTGSRSDVARRQEVYDRAMRVLMQPVPAPMPVQPVAVENAVESAAQPSWFEE